jgi:hypothetical protein
MPENYVLIERVELNASAASISFANIPQSGYTDLKIVASARSDRADTSDNAIISFNGLTTNLSYRYVQGNGASATSSSGSTGYVGSIDGSTATSSTFGNAEYYIPNYTSSNYKSISSDAVDETNATNAYATLTASLWSSTAAITSINLKPQVGSNFLANSTFSLYGIAAVGTTPAIAPKASGGNIIDYDGTYWIHTFTSSGTFTPQTGLICDYLVVAGGGGGGSAGGGGAGAGGYRTSIGGSPITLDTSTNYAVTVGAGGAGATTAQGNGTNGSNSIISAITSTGGGGGGSSIPSYNFAGLSGGSGGAGGYINNAGGLASPSGQGNNGAAGNAGPGNYSQGGGGGAGAVGQFVSNGATVAGAGGVGLSNSISGTATFYAGGGGGSIYSGAGYGSGGAGGNGGGGAGGTGSVGGSGTANRGGGGGAGSGSTDYAGGAGGSGIVIIRYPAA